MDQFSFLFSPAAAALGHTLLYSLGQAFVVFTCLRIVLKFIPNASSNVKYTLSYCGYLTIGTWFFITLFRQFSIAQAESVIQKTIEQNSFHQLAYDSISTASATFSLSFLNDYLPLIVAFYLMGILWYSIRLSISFLQTNRLKSKGIYELESEWKAYILKLAERMNVSRSLQTFFSTKINTPMMIGFFKPVILLPFAAMNQLSAEQFEAILLHELAHIRRNDYLLNILQMVLDTILFFNPFAWWITKNIREEREKSCDEMVLQLSDPFHYARALLALEEPSKNQLLVMTAIGKRSHLFHRIKNIMEMKNKHINLRQKFITLLVIATATISVAWFSPSENKVAQNEKGKRSLNNSYNTSTPQVLTFFRVKLFADTTPKGIAPLPPAMPFPPAPPVAMAHEGVPPLPPAPPMPPSLPGKAVLAPLPPIPPVAPLPPNPLNEMNDSVPPAANYFNSKEWKQQEEAIKKSTQEMRKYFQSDAWKKQQDLMKDNALAMKKYFNSDEWKKQEELMKKNGEEMKKYFNSDEWKKQEELMKKNGEEMKKYFNSPEWKKQQEEIKKNAEKMKEYFNSPEWKKQQEQLQHLSDSSLSAYFKSDSWQKQQENIQKAVAKSQQFFKSDVWKNVQENLEQLQSEHQKSQSDADSKKK